MLQASILFGDRREVLEVDTGRSFEVFRTQVFSLTDVPPKQQVLVGCSQGKWPPTLPFQVTLSDAREDSPAGTSVEDKVWFDWCSLQLLGARPVVQPLFFVSSPSDESDIKYICGPCALHCHGAASLSKLSGRDKAFTCECEMAHWPRGPHLSVSGCTVGDVAQLPRSSSVRSAAIQDMAAAAQETAARAGASYRAGEETMGRDFRVLYETVMRYEDAALQEAARAVIPPEIIAAASTGDSEDVLTRLLAWFKHEFFTWVDQPPCERCGASTRAAGSARPTAEEMAGLAQVVEIYSCAQCGQQTRFPRFNHPGVLLRTRRGRCGEWANCFALCCRAVGLEMRYVKDYTDHVWVEIYHPSQQAWEHADPCENSRGQPLLYEQGWGKKLTYVFAVSKDELLDVTRKYTRKYRAVLHRRTMVSEQWLLTTMGHLEAQIQQSRMLGHARLMELVARRAAELTCFEASERAEGGGEAGEAGTSTALPARTTGSLEWRKSRGETGRGSPTSPETTGALARVAQRRRLGPLMRPIDAAVRGLRVTTTRSDAERALALIQRYAGNILSDPEHHTFRRIRIANNTFAECVAPFPRAREVMRKIGFREQDGTFVLPMDASVARLEGYCKLMDPSFVISNQKKTKKKGKTSAAAPAPAWLMEMFGKTVLRGREHVDVATLAGKHVLVYFSAHWCGPCRKFTPQLKMFYYLAESCGFEVVFATLDKDEREFSLYYAEMPWCAVPFQKKDRVQRMMSQLNLSGIPALVLLSPSGRMLTRNGREWVARDPDAKSFPWKD